MIARGKQEITVELSVPERCRIAIETIKEIYGINSDWYLKQGNICYEEETYGHNRDYETKVVRVATREDVEAFNVINKIRYV